MNQILVDPETTDILVLDAHGVIFNNPLPIFLHELGERTGEGGNTLLARWRNSIRSPFWEGRLAENDMWHRVAPGNPPAGVRAELEGLYAPGPLFDLVVNWPNRLWILSNHRTDWLTSRLVRFGIDTRFEAVLVSDGLGATKPDPAAFRVVQREARRTSLLFIDDQHKNVEAARQLGLTATIVTRTLPALPPGHHPDEPFVHSVSHLDRQNGTP
jgi:FMN phosphatase YigB (HAD superfamily)